MLAYLEDAFLSAVAISLIWIILILAITIHEFGHALTALALGEKVHGITIGLVKLFGFKFFGIPVSIGVFPVGGVALVGSLDTYWLTKFMYTAAGPVASILTAVVGYAILGGTAAIDSLIANAFYIKPLVDTFLGQGEIPKQLQGVSESATFFEFTLVTFANINLVFGVFNLLPVPVLDGGGMMFSLLRGIFGKKVMYVEAVLIPISFLTLIVWIIYDMFF